MVPLILLGGGCAWGLGTLTAHTPRWTALYLVAIAAFVLLARHIWRNGLPKVGPIEAVSALAIGYAGVSLLWSADWMQGVYQWVNLATIATVFLWARHSKAEIGIWAAVAIVASLVMVWMWPVDNGGFGNRNFITEFLVSCLPLAFIAPMWIAAPASLAAVVYLVFLNPSYIEFFAAACFAALLAWRAMGWKHLAVAAIVIGFLSAAFVPVEKISARA